VHTSNVVLYARSATKFFQESPANTNHAQKLPPVPQLPHPHPQSQAVLSHTNHGPQIQAHSTVAWDAHQQYANHTGSVLPPTVTTSQHDSSIAAPWPIVETGESSLAPVVYEQIHDMNQDWAATERHPEHVAYAQHQAPVEQMARTNAQLQAHHRPPPKKKAAKVPSSFVERQEKLKVSKRKGPLQERQREKTHTMRKTKRICVRCRFYKSGVCMPVINAVRG
jgi:hypothetical protein